MLNASLFAIPPEQCTLATCTLEEAQVDYIPSLAGNSAFVAIFSLILLVHTVQGIRFRTWSVLVGMIAGLALEILGYIFRVKMHFNPFKSGNFIKYGQTVHLEMLDANHQQSIDLPDSCTCLPFRFSLPLSSPYCSRRGPRIFTSQAKNIQPHVRQLRLTITDFAIRWRGHCSNSKNEDLCRYWSSHHDLWVGLPNSFFDSVPVSLVGV